MKLRDIVFTQREPGKDVLWIGRKEDGSYFARVWNSGWRDIAGSDSVSAEEVEEMISGSHEEIGADGVREMWESTK